MKRVIITLVLGLLILVPIYVNAQDVIVKSDNTTIQSKITKVSDTEVEYKKWSNLDGPTYTIKKSEISSITYENGETENFVTNPKSIMERDGNSLMLDGRLLSDEEVRSLVGEENYKTFLSARRQINAGRVFTVLFVGTTIAAFYLVFDGSLKNDGGRILSGYGMAALADINLALLIVNKVAGKSRMNWVAREYNNKQNNYTLNISPSIIKYKTPQTSDNYALGITLKMNF